MTADAIQTDDIARAVPMFVKHQRSDDDTLLDAIVALGIDQKRAVALLDFMPIAFFHVITDGKIADLPDHYVRYSADQKPIGNVLFANDPIYVAARHYAENDCESDDLAPVSMRSAEFNAMNDMLTKGTPMEQIRLGPSVIMDYVPDDSSDATRPWWRFW